MCEKSYYLSNGGGIKIKTLYKAIIFTMAIMFLAAPFALIAPAKVSAFGQNPDIWPFDETKLYLTDSGNSITDGKYTFEYHSPSLDLFKNEYTNTTDVIDTYNRLAEHDNTNRVYTLNQLFTDDDSLTCKTTGDNCKIAYALLIPFTDVAVDKLDHVEIYAGVFNHTLNSWITKDPSSLPAQSGWENAGFISIKNPENILLSNTIIDSGRFWGGIIQNNWESGRTVADALNKGWEIKLYFNGGELAARGAVGATAPENRYNAFTIGEGGMPKFLSTGKYKIVVDGTDKLQNCTAGNGSAGWCTMKWKGEIEFTLSKENGTAYYTITKNPAPTAVTTLNQKRTLTMDFNPDFNILVSEQLNSPFDDFFQNALQVMTEWTTKAIVIGGGWVNRILMYGNDIRGSGTDSLQTEWKAVRNITLSILTLGILIIAFANILNFDLEKYGLNKMIPKLVLGILGTYFSFFICAIILEVASALQTLLLNGHTIDMQKIGNIDFEGFRSGASVAAGMVVAETIFLILLLIIVAVAMLYLCLVLIVRVVVIWFLVALAPLAFMMNVLPFTEFLFKQWWSKFVKWVFMGPAIAFLLWLTSSFLVDGFGTSFNTSATANTYNSWIFLLMAAAGIVMSAAIPMMLGGDIFKAIQNAASKVAKGSKYVPGVGKAQRAIKNRLDLRRGARDQREKFAAQQAQAKIAQRGGLGRFATGMNRKQALGANQALISQRAKEIDDLNPDMNTARQNYMDAKNETERAAWGQHLTSKGWVDVENKAMLARVQEDMATHGSIKNNVLKEQSDVLSALVHSGVANDNTKELEPVFSAQAAKNPGNLKAAHIQNMTEEDIVALGTSKERMRAFVSGAGKREQALLLKRMGGLSSGNQAKVNDYMRTQADAEHVGMIKTLQGAEASIMASTKQGETPNIELQMKESKSYK